MLNGGKAAAVGSRSSSPLQGPVSPTPGSHRIISAIPDKVFGDAGPEPMCMSGGSGSGGGSGGSGNGMDGGGQHRRLPATLRTVSPFKEPDTDRQATTPAPRPQRSLGRGSSGGSGRGSSGDNGDDLLAVVAAISGGDVRGSKNVQPAAAGAPTPCEPASAPETGQGQGEGEASGLLRGMRVAMWDKAHTRVHWLLVERHGGSTRSSAGPDNTHVVVQPEGLAQCSAEQRLLREVANAQGQGLGQELGQGQGQGQEPGQGQGPGRQLKLV